MPDDVTAGRDWFHWLLERAEEAASHGLDRASAYEAVRCAYSSVAADEDARRDRDGLDDDYAAPT